MRSILSNYVMAPVSTQIKDAIRLVHDKQEALSILKSEARPGDIIIVMAVGSFNRLAYELRDLL